MKDNYDFYKEVERAQEDYLEKSPSCAYCGQKTGFFEKMYNLDGWLCEECKDVFIANASVNVEDWLSDQRGW